MSTRVFQPYRVGKVGGRISPWGNNDDVNDQHQEFEDDISLDDKESLLEEETRQEGEVKEIKNNGEKFWQYRKKSFLRLDSGSDKIIVIPSPQQKMAKKGQIFPRRPKSEFLVKY
eukprot:TRINITY_DN2634_c0_g1_i3.p1 TRINITY_DN2634_c0_g1~~TRINITY_DN2634_c0_g1_i3.p1  ORF type:complete len:115 (-),score=22.76 TRINITY_DN2634_c0_g1_i3:3-347(-)